MKGPRIVVSRFALLSAITVVLAALTGGALADVPSGAPDDDPHLLVVPATPEGQAALASTDARLVARYGSFSLVEAAGADDERLRDAGADRRDDMRTVRTAAGALDPKRARRSLAGKEAPDRDEVLALVQFVGPPKDAWLDRLRSTGAGIVNYQAENAYVVHASGEAVDRLAALVGGFPPVRAVSVLTAADKLEGPRSPTGRYAVQTVAGGEGADARAEAAAAGTSVSPAATVGKLRTQYLALSPAEAAELAHDPAVVAVEPYAAPQLADERGAQVVAGNLSGFVPSAPGYLNWLLNPARIPDPSTFGFAIDVTDEGLDSGVSSPIHPDFLTQGSGASRVAYLNNYTSDPDARDCGGHGTNVASIATGYNSGAGSPALEDGAGFNHGLGVAPFAKLGASKIFTCSGAFTSGFTPATVASNAYGASARITNNSWGTNGLASWSSYSARAQQYDALVRDASPSSPGNQEMVEVFAAGNDGDDNPDNTPGLPYPNEGYGTILAEATAKNVITVGAAEGVRPSGLDGCGVADGGADSARDIINFSSRGPTDDGRLKPDLVAPGTHLTGARPQHAGYTGFRACTNPFGGPLYTLISGSSQAAPHVSGAAALVRHWYKRTHGVDPSPALTKGFLINTAADLAGGDNGKGDSISAGPNSDQGWGRVDVGNALDSTARVFRDQLPGDLLHTSGDSVVRSYAVDDPSAPVKVTLAWTDAPGPTVGNAFVNDIDLVVDAGGRTYKGNVFDGSFSRTGGTSDRRDNVESVYLPAGTSGPFAVRVVGSNIPGDGVPGSGDSTDQDFALVVSNADEQASPVLVHDVSTIDDSPSAGGDGDGGLEPTESFQLDERLRNAGDAGATSVSGTLTGGSGLTITQGNSGWPNLAVGAAQTNVTPFAATVSAGAPCGADVTGTLALTTSQGPQTVPIALPTGAEAAPVQRTQTPAAAIPDDDAAGVTSSINVAAAGRIKDLDVRITDLEHDFVGDLRIDITAPDGTTVTLANQPGGPDNFGKDFTNTIFDDEAPTSISAGTAPYTGRFRPQNDQLSRFNGKQQQGIWTLRVRDLFEGDTGVLRSWGTDTSPASCAVDLTTPDTTIGSGPAGGATVASSSASFTFSSGAAGATFECRLDGASFGACTSAKSYAGLVDGTHTFRVRAVNGPKTDPTPATRVWTVDTTPPNTSITSGPSEMSRVSDTTASFQFVSPDTPDATFECSVDGANFSTCIDPVAQAGLAEGAHSFRVRAWDAVGNVDASPTVRSWTVDRTAPSATVTAPASGSTTAETTPILAGVAGTSPGDDPTLVLKLWSGTAATGLPIQTIVLPRDGTTGAFAARPAALADGWYTVRAEQGDATIPNENIGVSNAATFMVRAAVSPGPSPPVRPVSVAPSFAAAPAEERLSDALANRYAVLAACASACRVSARLSASSRAARKLGLRARSLALGTGVKRLAKAGTAAVRVRLTGPARTALRKHAGANLTLKVTVEDGDRTLALERGVSLRRTAGLRRIVRRGLGLWAVCSGSCPLHGELTVSRSQARKLGVKRAGGARVAIATGRARGGRAPARLRLRVKSGLKKALGRRVKIAARLELTAGSASDASRLARRSLTLRR